MVPECRGGGAPMTFERVSIHGGHSGQFCNHGQDSLESVIQAYVDQGFAWVGLTEHMPPPDDRFLYPEERAAGLTAGAMAERFGRYVAEARRLQSAYADRIEILVGFETEDTTGAIELARRLIERYRPDYIVGSVHHVADIPFDYSQDAYRRAVAAAGGVAELYCRYFDRQHEMIRQLEPQVVGHFDLIRIFDADYSRNLALDPVQARLRRNLELVRQLDLILDCNVAALRKGAPEPYLSRPILEQARQMGIAVVPADDAHSAATVGLHIDAGIGLLKAVGFDGRWPRPRPIPI
jgi:histidinol-phosphatase (PHP family)